MYKSFILTITLALSLGSCAQNTFNQTVDGYLNFSVDTISTQSFSKIIKQVKIIDARSLTEYSTSKIVGAQFIDFDNPNFNTLQIAKSDTIVVYCTIGYRSEKIGKQLKDKGFTNVLNLYGGIIQWANDSNQVCNPTGMPTNSIHTYDASWGKWLTNLNFQKVN